MLRVWGLTLAVILSALVCVAEVWGQTAPAGAAKAANNSDDAERRRILESDRWRTLIREFNDWLSVQQVYRPEQVTALKAELKKRTESMSPRELEDFAQDMEQRLHVLMSPEAEDARLWLQEFMAVARNPEQQLGRTMPDVMNMTASQIRQEIQWLQRHRESRQQAHAGFHQSRATQAQSGRSVQAARQASRAGAPERSTWPANTPRVRSQYSPRRELAPPPPGPAFVAGPWGGPYFRPPPPPPSTR
jgi:hypothetical protein